MSSDDRYAGSVSYPHVDHLAVQDSLAGNSYGARYQASPVAASDPAIGLSYRVAANAWRALFGTGQMFNRHYGWLEPGS